MNTPTQTMCPQGHENPPGQAFCGTCGAALSRTTYDPTADGVLILVVFLAVVFLVMFVAAMMGSGTANSQDKFTTYAYVAGLGAAPWGLLVVITGALAVSRVRSQRR